MRLKGKLIEYSTDDGKEIKSEPIEVRMCTGDGRDMIAEILVFEGKKKNRAIHIPLKLLRRRVNDALMRVGQ